MPTQYLAKFGVREKASRNELFILDLANEYRQKLADLKQDRFQKTIDYRNAKFPALWNTMVDYQANYWLIAETEKAIKQLHSEKRDRNAISTPLKNKLEQARLDRKTLTERRKLLFKEYNDHVKGFRDWFVNQRNWKLVRGVETRKEIYSALTPPKEFAELFELHTSCDISERELSYEYQRRGLHSSIRKDIVDATQEKTSRTGPGIRYVYGKRPNPQPWKSLSLQFPGGVLWEDVLHGLPQLSARIVYTNHPKGGEESIVEITQQIGTLEHPCLTKYLMKMSLPISNDAKIQRWTLQINPNGRRFALPMVANVPEKRKGKGSFTYKLRWTVVDGGVAIADFIGDNVNETLIIPQWVVDRRQHYSIAQCFWDNRANEFLELRGINRSKKPGELHGVAALEAFCKENLSDANASELLNKAQKELYLANKISKKAILCIEDIYKMAASRVCRQHDFVFHSKLDIASLRRYDTRNLLKADVLPSPSREILFSVSPGKLRLFIKRYGLESVSDEPEFQDCSPTNLFKSYFDSLGAKTGTKDRGRCIRTFGNDASVKRAG